MCDEFTSCFDYRRVDRNRPRGRNNLLRKKGRVLLHPAAEIKKGKNLSPNCKSSEQKPSLFAPMSAKMKTSAILWTKR